MSRIGAALVALFLLLPADATAQTSPNLQQGQVLTPTQWNQLFINKQDTLGYVPMNAVGGVFTGRVVTAPPGASTSGFNLTPGGTPASPANGDLWTTTAGLFARINGVTIGPIGTAACPTCVTTGGNNVFTGNNTFNAAVQLGVPGTTAGTILFAGVNGGSSTLTQNAFGSYTNRLPSANGGLVAYVTPQYLGFKCDGTTEASIIQTAVNALPSSGGVIHLPQGSQCHDSSFVTNTKDNVWIVGANRAGSGGPAGNNNVSKLKYTGTNTRYLDSRSTFGFGLINIDLTYSSNSFTGYLVDISSNNVGVTLAAFPTIQNSYLGPDTNRTGTATLVNMGQTVGAVVDRNFFFRGAPAILGQLTLGQNTTTTIRKNFFSLSDGLSISSCGEAWLLEENSFEPNASGQAQAFANSISLPCNGIVFKNNWAGDVTVGGGTWFSVWGSGIEFSANKIAGDIFNTTNGIELNTSKGALISANAIEYLNVAINCTTAVEGINVTGNMIGASGHGPVTTRIGNPSNCTNITTEGNSPSISRATAGQIPIGQSGADMAPKTISGDFTISPAGVGAIGNLTTGVTVAGTMLHTNIAAPSTPASGKVITWSDSADLRFHDKNASGVIGTTVVADAGSANNFLTAISVAGAISKARPACANLSDSGTGCSGSAGITALTGDVTASGIGSVPATLATVQPAVHTWPLTQTFTVAPIFTDASGSRTALGLGSIATQAASAVAVTGGTIAGLTGLAIRDTSAAFDVTIAAVSTAPLSAGRTLTLDVGNVAHTLKFGTIANTITFPNLASFTVITSGDTGSVTNAMLANSAVTVNGTSISLGASATVTAAAGTLTGATLASGVIASSLTSFGSSPALTTPVITGLPTGTGVATANTVSTLVARDASGNFSAGTIIASLTGHASLDLALSALGTGVQTALSTNVGSAGAPVVNGGALGSPSSVGTLPAHTLGGTISGGGNQINNVIIGASTPLAGSFTTLVASTSVNSTTGGYLLAGATFAVQSGNYFAISEPAGNNALLLGNGTDPASYYQNTSHLFRSRTGGVTYATLGAAGLTVGGHILAAGTAPTISSCGTSPSISGGDNFGTVTVGTGVVSLCVVNFGTTWGATPRCVASSGTAIASMTVSATTTQLTIGGTSLTGDVINWVCGSTASLEPANDNEPAYAIMRTG